MGRIFISYRRKESADITGRLFDRLAGYFGPDSVSMDVDVLISGADYRTQIGKIIDQCDVLLAVIGEQWSTITDESGRRRLDNPDDQLRIEIATALEKGITVIPVLVHQSQLPGSDELPEDLAALAAQDAIEIQSGMPFNTDVQKLVDRLEGDHGLEHPDRRFPLELVLIPLGIILLAIGVYSVAFIPRPDVYINGYLPGAAAPDVRNCSLAAYRDDIRNTILLCTIPLALGPLLIVGGTRWCCLKKEARRERRHFSSGVGRRRMPKSGKAVACLGLGLASIGLGVVASIAALACGVWTFVDAKLRKGWVRGRSLAVFGMIVAIVGGGFTSYLHLSIWQFEKWLRHADVAEKALAEGNVEGALSAYQQSIDELPENLRTIAAGHFGRAKIFEETGQQDLAIEEITEVIQRCQPEARIEDVHDMNSVVQLLATAYGKRSDLYRTLGKHDLADEDRRREQAITMGEAVPIDSDFIEFYQEDAPAAPAPSYDEPPPPPVEFPVPVVDPSA